MKKLNKKGTFEIINAGMLSFIGFVLIVVLAIFLISTLKGTRIVCDANYDDGSCFDCLNTTYPNFNSTDNLCYNATTGTFLTIVATPGGTDAWNGTVELQAAANLPPQFAQIIVIVVIIVGILGMLAFVGYSAYQRMKG